MHSIAISQEVFEQWLSNLEQNILPQGRGVMFDRNTGAYCALGVLGYTLDPKHHYVRSTPGKMPHHYWDNEFLGINNRIFYEISEQNDLDDLTFPEIAKWLRENVKPKSE